jgi:hypothetical protein
MAAGTSMSRPEPVPRPNLFTNGDADAWAEQFHMLFYVLRMSPTQIAQIDYGLEPDHPEAFAVFSWAHDIDRTFPRVDVAAMIEAVRRRPCPRER